MLTVNAGHGSFIVDDVRAVAVIGRFPEYGSPVHHSHMVILAVRGVVVDVLHLPGKRCPIVMNIERAHEDPDQDLGGTEVLPYNVVDTGPHPFFDADHGFIRRNRLDVDDGTVGGAQDAFAGGRGALGIAKEPYLSPVNICQAHQQA